MRHPPASITDVSVEWPTFAELWRTLTFQAGFNTSVVLAGATLLGVAAGVIGVFALLRKRALMGDALSHATLPGIALGFIVAASLGYTGKSLSILLPAAAISGVIGVITVQLIIRHTRLAEDTAIGVVLSVFFGAGVVLLSIIQSMQSGDQAGVATFIYGQTAAMHTRDAVLMGAVALLAILAAGLLLKEFALVCFNDEFAAVQGWPVTLIDLLMMSLVVIVTVVGLQAVGLILVVAMLIIPPAAARFWTDRLRSMAGIAGIIGGVSGYLGAAASALLPRLPAGSVIVLSAGAIFFVSMIGAPRRGVLANIVRSNRVRLTVARDHLLRDLYIASIKQSGDAPTQPVPLKSLARERSWSFVTAILIALSLKLSGLIDLKSRRLALRPAGVEAARRVMRNRRLWEQYLVQYADVAPSHVDWSADVVEHVLSPRLVAELEEALAQPSPTPDAS